MDNLFMFDAFKALDSLNEDTFKVDDEGIEELSEFEKMDEIDDSIEIIDMHADDEEELEDSYIGKVILACNVCDSKVFEDKDNVIIDEETPDSANTDMECPYCHTIDGFKIIGEIGEFHKHNDEEEEIEVEEKESEKLEEAKHKEFTSEDDIDADMDDEKEEARKRWERKKNDARSKRDYRMKHDLEEDFKEASITTDREKMEMYSDENGKVTITTEPISTEKETFEDEEEVIVPVSDETEAEIESDSEEELEDENSEGEVSEESVEAEEELVEESLECSANKTEALDVIYYTLQYINNHGDTIARDYFQSQEEALDFMKELMETYKQESSDTGLRLEDSNGNLIAYYEPEIDVDFTDVDEESFDELAESYLKTIYSNVESYKTTNASATKDKFMLEGLITFASGAVKNTNFVFAPKAATKSGKLQFIGENLQITKNRNAFKFNASISNKKLLGESLTYNYSTKDGAGKMRKLYGTIKRK